MSDGNNGNDGEKKDLEIIYQDFMNREENGNEGFYNSRKQELQIKQFYCQYLARDEPVYTEQNRSLSQKVFDQHRKMLTERFPGYKVCLWPSFPVCATFHLPKKVIFVHPEHWSQPIIVYDQYGLRRNANGSPIDPSKKLIIIFGDSVMQGLMISHWFDMLNDRLSNSQYQVLNAALTGATLEHIKSMINEVSNSPLGGQIAHMIIFPGWHSIYNSIQFRKLLTQCVESAINPILVTIPLSIKEDYQDRHMVPEFLERSKRYGGWWGYFPYGCHIQRYFLKLITNINTIVNDFATERNIPVIDLHLLLSQRLNWENFHEYFFDLGHLDPAAYPELAEIFYDELAKLDIC